MLLLRLTCLISLIFQVYPAWKWFEKQDGIRALQKNSQDPAPEFYNIYLERPKVLSLVNTLFTPHSRLVPVVQTADLAI